MTRIAECSCGSLRVTAEGEPQAVVACHCIDCQRRTGSVFGVGAYYPIDQLTMSGESQSYSRPTDAGHQFTTYFCPRCGTSMHWVSGKNPGLVGVAVGAFADCAFPPPMRSVWERSRHGWANIDTASQHFDKGRI